MMMVPIEMTDVFVVEACERIGELAVVGLDIGVRGRIIIFDPEEIVEEDEEEEEEGERDRVEVSSDVGLTVGRLKGVVIGTMTTVVVNVALVVKVLFETVDVTVVMPRD